MTNDNERAYAEQVAIFERLSDRVSALLDRFGRHDSLLGPGDYSIYGDYSDYPQVKISIGNLVLLEPHIVKRLQAIVKDFPGWEIVIAVAVPGHYDDWPDMGLYIRANEIVDGLQRQYFPKEFQGLEYEGSRRGAA